MYKQVTDQIKDAIASGDLEPNDRLPSVRELSEALNVSAITVKRAYQDLETEGFILTRAGMGSFVAPVERDALRERKLAELQDEVRRLVRSSAKFGISADDIVRLTRQVEGE
jgi:GntR family transcriptional regulator